MASEKQASPTRSYLFFLLGTQLLLAHPLQAQEPVLNSDLSLDSLLNTPVSTVAKYAQTAREAAASVTIVTDEEIQSFGYRSIADVLAAVPGFYTTDDRQYLAIGVRGLGRPSDYNNRILLLVDGNTVNDNVTAAAATGPEWPFNMDVVDHIEVARGPASALYGSGALFAVVNVITKTGHEIDGLRLLTNAGSFGRRGVSAVAGGVHRGIDLTASALWDRSDGQRLAFDDQVNPLSNGGVADRQDWDRRIALLGVARSGGLTLLGRFSTREYGLPIAGYESDGGSARVASSAAVIRYDHELSPSQGVTVRGYLNWFRLNGRFPVAPDVAYDLHLASNARGAELSWRWDAASYSRLTAGVEYASHPVIQDFSSIGGMAQPPISRPNSVVSPYAQEYLTLGTRLSLVGGLRGDFYSDGRSTVVPRVAAIYQATRRTTLKLLYGDAIRVPTALEDVAVSRDPGATTLVAERLKTLEAIWDQRLAPWLQGSLSVFVYDSDNLIDERTDSATFQISYTNRSRVNVKGLEVTARSSLPSGFHGYAGLELVRTVDEATQRRLTNSPASMLKLGVSRPVLEIDVAAEVRHEAGRLNAHGGATAPFTLANLTLTRRPGSSDVPRSNAFAQRVEFMLQVRNLFDQTYRVPAALSSSQKSILQDRRSVLVRLGYRF